MIVECRVKDTRQEEGNFSSQKLDVKLTDDGKGFDDSKVKSKGIGFINMAKRVQTIGRNFNLISKVGKRVTLSLTVPL